MTVEFNTQEFRKEVLVHLETLCQEFLESIPFAMAELITKDYPELNHSVVMNAVSVFVEPDGDGSRDKAEEWFQFRSRDISKAFEQKFADTGEEDEESEYELVVSDDMLQIIGNPSLLQKRLLGE